MKIEKITDVKVNIDVVKPQPVVGLGNPAIFVSGLAKGCKVYRSLSALAEDHASGTDVYAKAAAIFGQRNIPQKVHVITYETSKVTDAASEYFYEEWHFALLAKYEEVAALALSNLIEEQEYKFFVVQVATATELGPFAGNESTIGLVHPLKEHLDAALIGDSANLPVGSITWKFRSGLVGITAQPLGVSEVEAIDAANGIAYISKAGVAQTSEGTTLSGEFIDAVHGTHWVKANMESQIQNVLTTSDKVDFDLNGIDLLNVTASNVLETATQQGIVSRNDEGKGNYAVTTLQKGQLDPGDVKNRVYKGLSFNYERSAAIHAAVVSGTIEV